MKLHVNHIRSRGRRRGICFPRRLWNPCCWSCPVSCLTACATPVKGLPGSTTACGTAMLQIQSAVCAGEEHTATQDMWLSPQSRLLADSSEGTDYVYIGQGHRLILPEGLNEGETLPLIIIGVGKSLQLKDVKLVHAASLPACIQLGSGMLLVTFPWQPP